MVERDHWLLISRPGDGKSTFASKMSPEYLVFDFDGRWSEQERTACGKSHIISSGDVIEVCQEAHRRLPDLRGKVGTVVVDSGTSVMDYVQAVGRLKAVDGKGSLNDAHRLKADTMRALRGAVASYHCNSLWIFHLEDGLMNGKAQVRSTISKTEIERLKLALNAILSIVRQGSKRGIKIEWCRYNQGTRPDGAASGQVVWDTEGYWIGVPQRLSVLLRNFKGTEGYNGNAYSREWLFSFLASKGKSFPSVDAMAQELGIETDPLWFDRAGWNVFVEKALA